MGSYGPAACRPKRKRSSGSLRDIKRGSSFLPSFPPSSFGSSLLNFICRQSTHPGAGGGERRMFGRVRSPSSSPEELERPTAKLLKHDSLSIYESTLLKLRVGSQHAKDRPPEEVNAESDGMDMEANCSSASTVCSEALPSPQNAMIVDDGAYASGRGSTLPVSSDQHGCFSSGHDSSTSKIVSINHLFSRYKDSKTASPSHDQMMTIENHCPPSIPPNPGKWSCLSNRDQQLEPERTSSITVGSM